MDYTQMSIAQMKVADKKVKKAKAEDRARHISPAQEPRSKLHGYYNWQPPSKVKSISVEDYLKEKEKEA